MGDSEGEGASSGQAFVPEDESPMSVLFRALEAALRGMIAILESLGVRGSRWEWRKRSWFQAIELRRAEVENLQRAGQARLRMCAACRALAPDSAAICPVCGAPMGRQARRGGGPLAALLPGFGSASIALLTVNVLMSLVVFWVAAGRSGAGVRLLISPPMRVLFDLGAKWTPAIREGEIWRLVTAGYLHGGLIHLIFNCYALMALGPLVEEAFGRRKFFLIYTASSLVAFGASALLSPVSLSIGASGALFGLLGFAFVFGRYRAGRAGRAISDQLMQWLILGGVMSLFPGIDLWAHLGGFVTGAFLALVVDPGEPHTPAGETLLTLLALAALGLTVLSFGAMAMSFASIGQGTLR